MAATTCLDLCTRALRQLGVIGAGEVASGQDGEDALEHLQALILDLPSFLKGPWINTTLTSAAPYAASDGERINTAGFAAPITFPTTYVDPDGCTAPILDLSRVHIIGADHAQAGLWVYSASRANWSRADALEMSGDSPFGKEDDAGLAALLAMDLSSEYGDQATVSDVTAGRARRQLRTFGYRFDRETPTPVDTGLLRMSDTGRSSTWESLV